MGGETCNFNPPRSNCSTAVSELRYFHYTYLNKGFHAAVLDSWRDGGCMHEIEHQLGYPIRALLLRLGVLADFSRH